MFPTKDLNSPCIKIFSKSIDKTLKNIYNKAMLCHAKACYILYDDYLRDKSELTQ